MTVSNTNIDKVVAALQFAQRNIPDPSVTLVGKKWKSPFLVLISCILSLRTKDETTLPASERLFKLATTPHEMLKLSPEQIQKEIYPVGFYKTKSRTILGICKDLIERFDGKVPCNLEDLLSLKGVGRKTANLVMTEGFNELGVCVDTHVHRISNRFGYVETKSPDETEMSLRLKLPRKHWKIYNSLLVVWGQNICRPISPKCSQCDVFKYCERRDVILSR